VFQKEFHAAGAKEQRRKAKHRCVNLFGDDTTFKENGYALLHNR